MSELPAGNNFVIGSPAVSRGGGYWLSVRLDARYGTWLIAQEWITACNGKCKYDFIPFHFYGTNATQLVQYAQVRPNRRKQTELTLLAILLDLQEASVAHRGTLPLHLRF